MRLILLYAMIGLTLLVVFGLSWVPSPHLSRYGFLPARLAHWTDSNANMNVRTAVPMVFLGFFSGIWLVIKKHEWYWWTAIWLVLVGVIFVAEVGQLLLPRRHFDWGDVLWGAFGAFGGMAAMWVLHLIIKKADVSR